MAIQVFTPEKTLLVESVICYLYTDPGLGKSAIAHTANKPVIFDFDKGQHRVAAELRRGTIIRMDSWFDLENLKDDFYSEFNTIVADTVGAMLDSIKDQLSKNSDNLQRDKTLTLKAQGLAGTKFMNMVRKWQSLGKDVVFIAHAVEEEAGKEKLKVYRPDLAGKNRNLLYRMADVMGYLHSTTDQNGDSIRTILFNPSPTHHGKNSGRLGFIQKIEGSEDICTGQVPVPELLRSPTFLADLLKQAKDHINTLTPVQAAEIKAQAELNNFKQSCLEANHAGDLNQLTESLDKEHAYYQSMRQALKAQAESMKCTFDKERNKWINPPEFKGISDVQRDQLQDFIAERGLDTRTVCEHLGIDSLMQIEVSQLQAVQADIENLAKQEIKA
ncbi:ATP-binding protein [Acinetobacter soli]|uniref:AAA family ATPase n=1 Tax=Acinetobacter soli TaxID=487316 RepID=A0A1P8EFP8_9GAMM|nr:ATP-binding protein [Acinetobacter soli]APV35033.1 AAA family ATPase [Acinetobacter soli]